MRLSTDGIVAQNELYREDRAAGKPNLVTPVGQNDIPCTGLPALNLNPIVFRHLLLVTREVRRGIAPGCEAIVNGAKVEQAEADSVVAQPVDQTQGLHEALPRPGTLSDLVGVVMHVPVRLDLSGKG